MQSRQLVDTALWHYAIVENYRCKPHHSRIRDQPKPRLNQEPTPEYNNQPELSYCHFLPKQYR
ncbi:hypothetical protein CR513_15829, partial [Mucuna pruriens]